MVKYLAINADDFGYCSQRNRAILEMLNFNSKHGISALTAVSVMVNAEASHEAINLIGHTKASVGKFRTHIRKKKLLVPNIQKLML